MPLASPYLAINARVSVAPRFLRSAGVYETLRTIVTMDISRPISRSRPAPETTVAAAANQEEDPDYMEDALDRAEENEELEELNSAAKEYASKTRYFLRFIPEVHIQEIILPATNQHASTIIPNFKAISYPECLLWIALWIIMTVIRLDNHAAYWQRGAMAGILAINFSKYMSMERFDTITKMHIFCRPDATRLKVPRKPHPVGQEYKTVADGTTCCILRVDVSGNTLPQEFDDQYSMKTISTVCRFTKPWFPSGRTIIADSWFGSPTMPKVVISNCGVITRSNRSIGRRLPDVGFGTMQRPQVIDEYENYKANAFSAYTMLAHDGHDIHHNVFRWKLGQESNEYARRMQNDDGNMKEGVTTWSQQVRTVHKRVSLGRSDKGHFIKRNCIERGCRGRSTLRCNCSSDMVFCQVHLDEHLTS
ncbi:hypothetical protein VTP01DRAFT_3424 [Rhizomucor pusillus]|uniref:uncharacterized protein n=1 Tax=Rhizomucor pusillus TaxID=4840 RepID=UPI0037446BD6